MVRNKSSKNYLSINIAFWDFRGFPKSTFSFRKSSSKVAWNYLRSSQEPNLKRLHFKLSCTLVDTLHARFRTKWKIYFTKWETRNVIIN